MEEASKRIRRRRDPEIDEIIKEIATRNDMSEERVRSIVNHFFDWQWRSFHEAEYAEYYWPKFGKFTWFNRGDDDPRFKEGIDEYLDERKIKDKNKSIYEEEIEISEDKQILIKEITSYDPRSLKCIPEQDTWSKYGWSIGGSNPESGWNIKTLKRESIDILRELEKLLTEYGSKG